MRLSPNLFRRHGKRSSNPLPFEQVLSVLMSGKSKIGNVWLSQMIHEHVGRLQIAMNHALLVNVSDCLSDVGHNLGDLGKIWPRARAPLEQVSALDILLNNEGH